MPRLAATPTMAPGAAARETIRKVFDISLRSQYTAEMKRTSFALATWLWLPCGAALFAQEGLRVDLNQNNQRGDVRTPGWENWPVPDGSSATATFGPLSVTLRKAGGGGLTTGWWKPGFDYPATMGS